VPIRGIAARSEAARFNTAKLSAVLQLRGLPVLVPAVLLRSQLSVFLFSALLLADLSVLLLAALLLA